jgi:uncharacterized membrane protein
VVRLHDFIDVAVPCDRAYQQWLAFEEYPRFMAGVHEVKRHDPSRLRWRAEVEGHLEEWEAEIVDNVPPLRLAWHGSDGRTGIVVLRPTPIGGTRVFVEMDLAPLTCVTDTRHYVEAASYRMHADLEHFKEWVEFRELGINPAPG